MIKNTPSYQALWLYAFVKQTFITTAGSDPCTEGSNGHLLQD